MKSLNTSSENCRRSGVIGLGLVPRHGDGPATISIKVSHGLSRYEVAVPSNSNFGYLKSVICHNICLNPEKFKLFFGGVEKEDGEYLELAGVTNNSEVSLMEVTQCERKVPEEVQETCVVSKGEDAVAEVRKEVDKLFHQASALQAVVESGNRVDEKEIIYLTEMLMRLLLKLDGIEAEGEGRVQRKMEVRRVQSIVETLDALKSRNTNPISNAHRSLSAATHSSALNSDCQSMNNPSPMPSSSPSPVPQFMHSADPSSTFPHMPYSVPHSPHFMHSTDPSSTFMGVPYYVPNSPSAHFTTYTPYTSIPSPMPYYNPSPVSYLATSTLSSSTPSPVPYYVPPHGHPSAPFSVPSSYNVTQNWEHFD